MQMKSAIIEFFSIFCFCFFFFQLRHRDKIIRMSTKNNFWKNFKLCVLWCYTIKLMHKLEKNLSWRGRKTAKESQISLFYHSFFLVSLSKQFHGVFFLGEQNRLKLREQFEHKKQRANGEKVREVGSLKKKADNSDYSLRKHNSSSESREFQLLIISSLGVKLACIDAKSRRWTSTIPRVELEETSRTLRNQFLLVKLTRNLVRSHYKYILNQEKVK